MTSASLWSLWVIVFAAAPVGEDFDFDSDGVKIHYKIMGKGEPVFFNHGLGVHSGYQWLAPKIADALAKDFQLILIDSRGHGKSDKPHARDQYGKKMVADQIRLMDHLKIHKASFVGYSMGAMITAQLMTTHPQRVRCGVLAGAGPVLPNEKEDRSSIDLAESLENGKGYYPLFRDLNAVGRAVPTEKSVRPMNIMMSSMNDELAIAAAVRSFRDLAVDRQQLKDNKVPALILIGDRDPLRAKTVDPIVDQFGSVRVEVIPLGDHMNTYANPRFLELLRAFLKNPQSPAFPPLVKELPAKRAS